MWADGNALHLGAGVAITLSMKTQKDGKMKKQKKETLLDFYREEGRRLDLMNTFMARFHKGDIIYVCGMNKGNIPGFSMKRYEVDRTVSAAYMIRRHLFKAPEFTVLQKPEFWARSLGGRSESLSSVNNYLKTEYAEGKEAYDQIWFREGAAYVIHGELSVRSNMVLEVFGSPCAYFTKEESIEQYETYEKFKIKYITSCLATHTLPHSCVARISPEPVLVFHF